MLDAYEASELLTGRDTHLGGPQPGNRNVVLSPMFLLRTWQGPHSDLLQSAKFLRRMERYLGIKGIVLVRLEAQDAQEAGHGLISDPPQILHDPLERGEQQDA